MLKRIEKDGKCNGSYDIIQGFSTGNLTSEGVSSRAAAAQATPHADVHVFLDTGFDYHSCMLGTGIVRSCRVVSINGSNGNRNGNWGSYRRL